MSIKNCCEKGSGQTCSVCPNPKCAICQWMSAMAREQAQNKKESK